MEWNRQKIKECLDILKQLPDFDKLPLPKEWGTLYDIPITENKALSLNSYLKEHKKIRVFAQLEKEEFREPAPGGVRTFDIKEEPLTLEVKTKFIDQNGNEIPELPPLVSEQDHPATESTEIKQLENQVSSPIEASQ